MNLAPVTAGYLPAVGVRLLKGRDFTEADATASPPPIVLSASAVPFFFPDKDPVGEGLSLPFALPGSKEKPRVVGIASDVKYSGLDKPRGAAMYVLTFAVGSTAVAVLAIAAAWLPARRAAEVSPAELMREE